MTAASTDAEGSSLDCNSAQRRDFDDSVRASNISRKCGEDNVHTHMFDLRCFLSDGAIEVNSQCGGTGRILPSSECLDTGTEASIVPSCINLAVESKASEFDSYQRNALVDGEAEDSDRGNLISSTSSIVSGVQTNLKKSIKNDSVTSKIESSGQIYGVSQTARLRRTHRTCAGRGDGAKCIFTKSGVAAQIFRQSRKCAFCDLDVMRELIVSKKRRAALIKRYRGLPNEIKDAALEYVPIEFRGLFQQGLRRRSRCIGYRGFPCVFAPRFTSRPAGPALALKGQSSCIFCSPDVLDIQCRTPQGLKKLRRKMLVLSPEACNLVYEERLPNQIRRTLRLRSRNKKES